MAVTNWDAYLSRVVAPHQPIYISDGGVGMRGGKWASAWIGGGIPPAATTPSTAVAPDRTTTGAIGQQNPVTANQLRIFGLQFSAGATDGGNGSLIICDRLSHQGGLSGTVTTEQTTNLPTAALTRYTSGVGVMLALEIYTTIGATGTTVTVNYTNQAGTSGRTSLAIAFGNTNFREAGSMLPIPLQAGDSGVRSVEGVTVLATTGTAGNFGVTLFKPILTIPTATARLAYDFDAMLNLLMQLEPIIDNACLWNCQIGPGNNWPNIEAKLYIAED